jgi:hypothetical protein
MKAVLEALPVPVQFKPFTVTLHIETADEAKALFQVGNFSGVIGSLLEEQTKTRSVKTTFEDVHALLKPIYELSSQEPFNGHREQR